jgi:hypothetical protein
MGVGKRKCLGPTGVRIPNLPTRGESFYRRLVTAGPRYCTVASVTLLYIKNTETRFYPEDPCSTFIRTLIPMYQIVA